MAPRNQKKTPKIARPTRRGKATKKTNPLGNVTIRSRKAKGRGGFLDDLGERAGAMLGRAGAGLLGKVFGLGEYSVKQNTITQPNNPPILSNTTSGTRIQHREYLGDIVSTTGFTVQVYPINPGIGITFPWLSGVAQYFEQYQLWGALVEYKSTSAVALNSTSTGLGTVIIATEYDVTKPPFQDKRSMENYMYCTTAPPSVSMLHPIECARDVNVLNTLYIRGDQTPASTLNSNDKRFSDLGNINVATIGMPAAGSVIGELWITYDVELLKPRLAPSISSNTPSHYSFNSTLFNPSATAPDATDFFTIATTGQEKFVLRGVGATTVFLDTRSINFVSTGTYVVTLSIVGTAAALGAITIAIASGSAVGDGTLVSTYYSTAAGTLDDDIQVPVAGVTSARVVHSFVINVTRANQSQPCQVTYTFGTLPTSIVGSDLTISTMPQGFTSRNPALDELRRALREIEVEDEIKWVQPALTNRVQDIDRHITSRGLLW